MCCVGSEVRLSKSCEGCCQCFAPACPCHAVTTTTTTTTSVCAAVTCLFRPYHVVVARHVWDLICSSFGQLQLVDFPPSGGQALIIYFYHPNGGSTATQPSVVRPLWERACTGGGRLVLTVKKLGWLCNQRLAPAIKGKWTSLCRKTKKARSEQNSLSSGGLHDTKVCTWRWR